MAETLRGLTAGEKRILKELKSIADNQKLVSDHLLSLERVFWQLLIQFGEPEEGIGEFDSLIQMEHHARRKTTHKN